MGNNEVLDKENLTEEKVEEKIEEATEAVEEAVSRKKISEFFKSKKFLHGALITVFALAVIYAVGVWYYSSHFFFGTQIGTFNCSNLTPEKAREKIEYEIENYTFTFFEKNGVEEVIKGDEIYLNHTPVENLDALLEKQNEYTWFLGKKCRKLLLDIEVTYDRHVLYNRITQMDFSKNTKKNMEGKAADIYFENGQYYVKDDGTLDITSVNMIHEKVKPKIKELYRGMSLEKEGCYVGLAGDDMMKGVLNLLNKFAAAKVTYLRGDEKIVLDINTIKDWVTVNEKYSVRIDEKKAEEYVNSLAEKYDTKGKERTFKTSKGEEVKVSGGNYGWLVDRKEEKGTLLNIIWNGETHEREPVYHQKARSHGKNDLGNTYVEISLGSQHLWYYKDGELKLETDVVTGNPFAGNATPPGTYYVVYKDRNAILRGADYETPVSFWMPFNGGIGLHDATWRGSFGGNIYRGGGSHGCINMPYKAAQTIFEHIQSGDPVILY